MGLNNNIRDSVVEHNETKLRFRVSPNLHARAHVRTVACGLAEFIYEAACKQTEFYRILYATLAAGKSLSYDGCDFPADVAGVLKYHLINVDSAIREMALDQTERRQLLTIFADTMDYNVHRLMQV